MNETDLDLDKEIDAVLGKLMSGSGDPKEVLRGFVRKVRGSGSVTRKEKVHECPECGEPDAPCFRCKATEVLGEKALEAAPMVGMHLAGYAQQWWKERQEKKAQEAIQEVLRAQQQAAQQPFRPPPPPAGPQRF